MPSAHASGAQASPAGAPGASNHTPAPKFRIWFERMPPPEYAAMLAEIAEIAGPASATPEAPLSALPGSHGIVASARIRYDAALMDQTPTLRVISRTGIGVDNISIEAATQRRIAVCNAPDAPSLSTAEHTLALILATAKHLRRCEWMLRDQNPSDFFTAYEGLELYGCCLGVVGLGRIGRRVAQYGLALGMRVVGYDPLLTTLDGVVGNVELAGSLEEVLRVADVVTLHLPLTPATHHLMNAERLALMKRGAYVVNTARGGLVDEAALRQALETGHLGGAGLDVFDPEPPDPQNPLLLRPEVVATPHIAGATRASKERLWRAAITQVLQVLRGERPENLINPDAWPVREIAQ